MRITRTLVVRRGQHLVSADGRMEPIRSATYLTRTGMLVGRKITDASLSRVERLAVYKNTVRIPNSVVVFKHPGCVAVHWADIATAYDFA